MTDEAYTGEQAGLKAKLADLTAGARDTVHAALKEAMTWNAYQWTVLALLTATFVLVALSYGGIRAELAALREARGSSGDGAASISADLDKQMSDLKSGLSQSLTDMKTGLDAESRQDKRQARRPQRAAEARRTCAEAHSEAEAAIAWNGMRRANPACAGDSTAARRARAVRARWREWRRSRA